VRLLIVVQGGRISASIYLFAYLSVCNAQECKKYLIQSMGVLTLSLQYQDMNCYLCHWVLWYKMIMGFEVARWIYLPGCEYIYTTIHFEYCYYDHKSCTADDFYYSWQLL